MSTELPPREQGRRAFTANLSIHSNPFKTGTPDSEEWARGFAAAQWAARVHENADWAEESRARAARIIKAEESQ